jgi:hypothetical protein
MFRRFDFEKELYETLDLIPLSVRRKLDLAGVKLHLNQWQALSRVERLVVCHFPAGSPEERGVLGAFLRETVKRCAGTDVATMKSAAPDDGQVPPDVARLVAELGLPEKHWSLLDPDERFALAKMARGGADKFMSAWSEFADKRRP